MNAAVVDGPFCCNFCDDSFGDFLLEVFFFQESQSQTKKAVPTRWAPTSFKWSCKPYKWPYKCVTGVITLLIGVITPFITSRGPTL